MRVLGNLVLVAVVVLVTLLVGEGLVRAYLALVPAPSNSPYISDADAIYRARPDPPEVRSSRTDDYINTFGFRDKDHPVEKPEGTYRVLGIGDSFVYGDVPLEQNFLRVTEAALRESLRGDAEDVEMILMGLGGYSPENQVGLMRSLGLSLDPDFVALSFFVGNDITGIKIRGEVYRGQIYYVGSPNPWLHVLRRSRLFLIGESALLTRIKPKIIKWRRAAKRGGGGESQAPKTPERELSAHDLMVTEAFLHIQSKRMPTFQKTPGRELEGLWVRAEEYLSEFDEICESAGIPWLLYLVPSEIQVDEAVRTRVLSGLGLSGEQYDFDAPQRRLVEFARTEGIAVLDPLPLLRAQHNPDDRLYIPNNTHWNERGNRIAGEILAEAIAGRYREANP